MPTTPTPTLIAILTLHLAAGAQTPTSPLIGTVLDPDGAPLADALVRVSRCDGRLFMCLDTALRHEWHEIAHTRTDRRGRFGLQVPLGLALRVEVDAAPHAQWVSGSAVLGEDLEIRLERPSVFTGQLVDAATGRGTPGALRAWDPITHVERFHGRTDAEGRFRFDRLAAGRFVCDVEPDEVVAPAWYEGALEAGSTHEYTPQLARGFEATGRVTDEATGAPIAGALVGEGWTMHKQVRTNADGRYVLRGCGDEGRPDLHCRADGYEGVRFDREVPMPGPLTHDFVLRRGVDVVGRVVDAGGSPLANAYVAAISANGSTVPWLSDRTDADGAFVCRGMPRGADGILMVRCVGHASVVVALPRAVRPEQLELGTVSLPAPRLVQGVVENADGSPAPGIDVCLRGIDAAATRLAALPASWALLSHYAGCRSVRTDANGRFAFGDVAPGHYEVAFGGAHHHNPAVAAVTTKPDEDVPLLRLRP